MTHAKSVCALLALALSTVAPAQAQSAPAGEDHSVIVRAGAPFLRGSRFAHLGELQRGLNSAIHDCGLDQRAANPIRPLIVDGEFGLKSRNAVRAVRACAQYAVPGEPADDAVTVALWNRLAPGFAPPDPVDRAFILRLTHEGTDYDRLEWNFTDIDPAAFGTWGPDGATFGRGGEVQQILSTAETANPGALAAAFAAAERDNPQRRKPMSASQRRRCVDIATLAPATTNLSILQRALPMREDAVSAVLLAAFCDEARAGVWERAFLYLGENTSVRDAYNTLYARELGRYARNAYAAWPAGLSPTQIDFAFFLDGGVQFGPRQSQTQQRQAFAGADGAMIASSPARRLLLARTLFAGTENECSDDLSELPRAQRIFCDRLGRDMTYVIDLAPIAARERSAWEKRSRLRASDVGLSDTPMAMPDHFLAVLRPR